MINSAELPTILQVGPAYQISRRLGMAGPKRSVRLLKVLLLLLVTWLPLLVLSLIAGHAFPGNVSIPLLNDLEANSRLLIALPLLELAAGIVHASFSVQVRSFLAMDLVPERHRSTYDEAQRAVLRLRGAYLAEGAILLLAFGLSLGLRLSLGLGAEDSSWERAGSQLTLAGWWHAVVSLPILYFLVLRWVWVLILWALFLFRVSRMDLELTATHPDRVGGLGFVAWGVSSFAPLLMAAAAMATAGLAEEMFQRGVVFGDLKYDIAGFVAVSVAIVYAPLLTFCSPLARCRFRGLLQFGKLVLEHDRAFEEKWLNTDTQHGKALIGTADLQTLADAGTCYEHVDDMWLFPFDSKAFAVLALSALLPFSVLLRDSIKDVFLRLGEMLV